MSSPPVIARTAPDGVKPKLLIDKFGMWPCESKFPFEVSN